MAVTRSTPRPIVIFSYERHFCKVICKLIHFTIAFVWATPSQFYFYKVHFGEEGGESEYAKCPLLRILVPPIRLLKTLSKRASHYFRDCVISRGARHGETLSSIYCVTFVEKRLHVKRTKISFKVIFLRFRAIKDSDILILNLLWTIK